MTPWHTQHPGDWAAFGWQAVYNLVSMNSLMYFSSCPWSVTSSYFCHQHCTYFTVHFTIWAALPLLSRKQPRCCCPHNAASSDLKLGKRCLACSHQAGVLGSRSCLPATEHNHVPYVTHSSIWVQVICCYVVHSPALGLPCQYLKGTSAGAAIPTMLQAVTSGAALHADIRLVSHAAEMASVQSNNTLPDCQCSGMHRAAYLQALWHASGLVPGFMSPSRPTNFK